MSKTRYPTAMNYSEQNIVPCECKQCGRQFPSKNKRRKHVCEREFYFWSRCAEGDNPAGVTVSKRRRLPDGDFGLTEYKWGHQALWFVDADRFTANQRQAAGEASGMR